MKNYYILIFTVLFTGAILAQNYKQVKIFIKEKNDLVLLKQAGVEIDHGKIGKDNSVIAFLSDQDFDRLKKAGFAYKVLIENWQEYYSGLPKLSKEEQNQVINSSKAKYGVEGLTFGSMGGFYTLQEVYNQLDSMFANYPQLITQKSSIGTSLEGRDIFAVKISDNPTQDEDEPEVFFNSLIHAREPAAMMTLIYYMYYLLENYGTDPVVTYLVDNREIYFIPVFNVDGYEYNRQTNPNGGGMWRKNRRNNGSSFGVDLNRNFSFQWGYDNNGSSGIPSSETYRGTAAFSEPETQVVRDFVNSRHFKTGLNYHTYSDLLIFPWGYITQETPDSIIFREYASDMTADNNYEYGISGNILYNVNGDADDWMYGEQTTKGKMITMTPEVGSASDGFWPQQSRIFPLAQENLSANLYITWVAGGYVSVVGALYNRQYFNPSDNVNMKLKIKNKGLSTAHNLNFLLQSPSPYITINNGTSSKDSLSAQQIDSTEVPFTFSISDLAPIGTSINLVVGTNMEGVNILSDTLTIKVGTPQFLFEDNQNDPAILWNITSTPATPVWDSTTADFYSSPTSYTDSKNGQYVSNATVTLTLKDPVDLTGISLPKLSFWTRYNIESNWDCGQVQLSTNSGSSWISLGGSLSVPGSGNGEQPLNEPVYEGNLNNWSYEEIDLTPYEGNQVLIRFQFRSDASVVYDGWYLDDINIFYLAAVPVELTSFTAVTSPDQILLKWETSTEINNSGFEIQRSIDKIKWEKIGFIEGAGTTTEKRKYNFSDLSPLFGKSFYRLIQLDLNGTSKVYSAIETEFIGNLKYSMEQNYPNPFNPSTIIKYQIAKTGNVKIIVYDILGNEITVLVNSDLQAGNYEAVFNSNSVGKQISSGIYFYTIYSGSFISTNKMLLLK